MSKMVDKFNEAGMGVNLSMIYAQEKGKVGAPRKYTAEELAVLADEWISMTLKHTVDIETGRNNTKTGEMIGLKKPEPPLVESFMSYIGMSWEIWQKWLTDEGFKEYGKIARKIKDFCNTQVLRYMFLGIIPEKTGIFYLVNNSRYVDKAEVVQHVGDIKRPSWLNKDTGKLSDDLPAIPDQEADYEEL